jgi:hypothetical protein
MGWGRISVEEGGKGMRTLMVAIFLGMIAVAGIAQAVEPVLIGRVAYIEGGVLRYVPAEDDWVATVEDSPLRVDDILYTEGGGRAEFIFPNNAWVRIGGNTGVEVVTLRRDLTGLYVDGGTVRIYNRAQDALVRVDTRVGYLAVEPGDVVDLYVGDREIQVIALEGSPNFFFAPTPREEIRYEVFSDGPALFIDETAVEAGEPLVDREWDDWNYRRDTLWAQRRSVRSAHLPEAFQTDAHVFEEHGRWERVYYRNSYVWCWTPARVDVTWRPFTVGRWTTYYEENVWVPYEPWGWVTHHYGHWIHVENRWWWTPYISVDVVTPGVDVRVNVGVPPPPDYYFYWHPGRVAWIHSEVHVGWFPLAPWEPYYGWHPWYGNTVVVNTANITNININIANYSYFSNAVIVNYDRFYNVPYGNNYIQHNVVNITNINQTTIINNYRPAPVIHKTVIKNVNVFKNQYNFSDRTVVYKPHHSVVEKAHFAKSDFGKRGFVSTADYRQKMEKAQRAEPRKMTDPNKRLAGLAASNKLVKPDEVKKPVNQVKFQQGEHKLRAEKPKLHDEERHTARQLKKASLEGEAKREERERKTDRDTETVGRPTPGAKADTELGRPRDRGERGTKIEREGDIKRPTDERVRGEGRRLRPDREQRPEDLGGARGSERPERRALEERQRGSREQLGKTGPPRREEMEPKGGRKGERIEEGGPAQRRKTGEEKLRRPEEPPQEKRVTDRPREERPGGGERRDRTQGELKPGTPQSEEKSRGGARVGRGEELKPGEARRAHPGQQEGPSVGRERPKKETQPGQDRELTNKQRQSQERRPQQERLHQGPEQRQIQREQLQPQQHERQRERQGRQEQQRQLEQRRPEPKAEHMRQQNEQQRQPQRQQKIHEQEQRQTRQERQGIQNQGQMEREKQRHMPQEQAQQQRQLQQPQTHRGAAQGQQGQEEGQKKEKKQAGEQPQ